MAGQLDDAAKQILGTLLADFNDRGLTARDLKNQYEGPQIVAVATAVCNIDDITQVDFDVAFSELENKRLIQTGPMEAFKNHPSNIVFFGAGFSKREYVYLTEEGYKAARRTPNRPQHINRAVNHVHISGGQFNNLQLATGDNINQNMSITNNGDSDTINKLISILDSQGLQVTEQNRADITSAVAAANEGDGKEAKSLLAKVCGPVWESVQPVMWPILGELLKRSWDI